MSSPNILLVTFWLLLCLSLACAEKRSLSSQVNPDCNENANECKSSSLVYIQSSGSSNTYHYLWAFIFGYTPAFFSIETDNQAKLEVDWKKLTSKDNTGALQFVKGSVINSFATELSHLYFVNFTNSKVVLPVPLSQLQFKATKLTDSSSQVGFKFDFVGTSPLNGSISFELRAFNEEGRSASIPRLQYTQSSNLMELTVKNIFLPSSPENKYIKSQLVSNLTYAFEGKNTVEHLQESVGINDEYTPGVFQRFIYTNTAENASAYVEWKPVAYYDDEKVIAKSIKVTNPVLEKSIKLSPASILNAYFSGSNRNFQVSATNNFKFGNEDDDFNYQDNKYLQFSLAFGLNKVPKENLSLALAICLGVSIGLPMVLFLFSIIYTIIRKLRNTNNEFVTLSEEIAH